MPMTAILIYVVFPVFAVILAGYLAGRRGMFSTGDARTLNKVVLHFALPAALFISMVENGRREMFLNFSLLAVSAVGIMGSFFLVYYIFRHLRNNSGAEGAVSALIGGSPAIGFLGFAVMEPIFGEQAEVALIVTIVGILVNAVGIPVGLALMNSSLSRVGNAPKGNSLRPVVQALSQPVAWAPMIAVVWVVCGIPWPEELSGPFRLIKGANASLAVFTAGITLSGIHFRLNGQVILGTIFKLLIMPGITLLTGMAIGMNPTLLKMLVVASALPPAFSGIIIADEYDVFNANGTSTLMLSMILFSLTLPLWLWMVDTVFNIC